MPEYRHGTPSWVELSSPDTDASAAFYREVMGWTTTEAGPVEETGGYRMFQTGGQNVAGLSPLMQESQPVAWSTYVSVDDADEVVAKVKAAGGTVIVEPMDVMDIGRMAFFADPAGAAIGVWQPKSFTGADVVNEPGSLCWNEVLTRDAAAGRAFYPAVFGWSIGRPQFEGAPDDYVVWEVDGRAVGGMMQMSEPYFPPDLPPHWSVCFAVADCDATVAKARAAGGTIAMEPMDMSIGRFAGIVDPQGAAFAVMRLAYQS
jgi:uncharacterized protein